MPDRLTVSIHAQPDDSTCGPTCLQAVYEYFGDRLPLARVIQEVDSLATGGTLGALLGCHALQRGYQATLYTCNLRVFDPTWFPTEAEALNARLEQQRKVKPDPKLQHATDAYAQFLNLGGRIRMQDLSHSMLLKYLERRVPIITGLSSTWLYREARETPDTFETDDIRGEPSGHFVVLCGYDHEHRSVVVADPYDDNPHSADQIYELGLDRVLNAILLGIMTYDANLLVLEEKHGSIVSE